MTALAFVLLLAGLLLVWAGLTGAKLIPALQSVLKGQKPAKP